MAHIRQLNSGKWNAIVRITGCPTKCKTFAQRKDAKRWADGIEHQMRQLSAHGTQPAPKGYTVGDLIDRYISDTPEGQRTKTATLKMLKKELGAIQLAALNQAHVRDFIIMRRKTARGVTIAADLSFFGAVLKFGRNSLLLDIPDDLALRARTQLKSLKLDTRSKERDRVPTPNELNLLFNHWNNNKRQSIPMALICKFAMATAMRQQEICSLRIEDISEVNPNRPTVKIRDRKDPQKKIGNHQTVPLLPEAWEIARSLIGDRTSGRVFPYNSASVSTAFTRACKAVKIDDLHFHDLRHHAVCLFFRIGLDIPTISLLTGHKDWKMLQRYTHITADDVFDKLQQQY